MVWVPARVKVPVMTVVIEAYHQVFGQLGLLLETAWLPLLILLAASILPDLFLPGHSLVAGAPLGFTLSDAVEAVVAIFCLNAFAVRWHQIVLYGGPRAIPAGLFRRAFARFLLYTIALYLASLLLIGAIAAASAIVGASATGAGANANDVFAILLIAAGIASALLWLATARLALLFPAAAYGDALGWGAAWRLMRGNSWRLIACGVLGCAPFVLTVAVVMIAILSAADRGADMARLPPSLGFLLLRGVIDTVTNFVVVALGASILSRFYRRIVLGERDRTPLQR